MREQVEFGRRPDLERAHGTALRGLRLVEPWRPDVSVDDAQLDRQPAMVVMQQLLDAWRTAERLLAATDEESPERPHLQVHAATLRLLYQGLFAQVQDGQSERPRA